jgi:hypothetical protein
MSGNSDIFLLGALVFLGAGVYLLWRTINLALKLRASKNWLETSGTITTGNTHCSSNSKGGRHYWAEFSYEYNVLGSKYIKKFKIESTFESENTAAQAVLNLPVGSTIMLRYHPDKPKACICEYDHIRVSDVLITVFTLLLGVILFLASQNIIQFPAATPGHRGRL